MKIIKYKEKTHADQCSPCVVKMKHFYPLCTMEWSHMRVHTSVRAAPAPLAVRVAAVAQSSPCPQDALPE